MGSPSKAPASNIPNVSKIDPKNLKKRTMVKPTVGKCRAPTYNLPQGDYIYGMTNAWGEEGSGDVLSSWSVSKGSKAQETTQSFPATNRQALANGCLTAKSQRQFGSAHPVMKLDPKSLLNEKPKIPLTKSHAYGIKSEQNEIPMKLIMSAPDDTERDYPDFSGVTKRGKMPSPKGTKSSYLSARSNKEAADRRAVEEREVSKAAPEFKMKRFKNISSKIEMGKA
jgi:hypothetical protein